MLIPVWWIEATDGFEGERGKGDVWAQREFPAAKNGLGDSSGLQLQATQINHLGQVSTIRPNLGPSGGDNYHAI